MEVWSSEFCIRGDKDTLRMGHSLSMFSITLFLSMPKACFISCGNFREKRLFKFAILQISPKPTSERFLRPYHSTSRIHFSSSIWRNYEFLSLYRTDLSMFYMVMKAALINSYYKTRNSSAKLFSDSESKLWIFSLQNLTGMCYKLFNAFN